MIPAADNIVICFAHVAYRLQERFAVLETGIKSFAVREPETLANRVGEADVLLISGLWQNQLLDRAKRLRFIQSIGAGTDQFPREELAKRGIRLASARGVNARAVAEHAMALMLALSRRLPEARDNQGKRVWRGMIGDLAQREDELGGKTLLVVGLGDIGGRLAQLAKAFDMHLVGLRRHPALGRRAADAVHAMDELNALLPEADFVVLTCPLTAETENLIDAAALGRMKPTAQLVNVARGRIVDPGACRAPHRRRRHRRDVGRTADAEFAALGDGACADHAPHRGRDPALRGQRHRDPARQSGASVAWRNAIAQPDRLKLLDQQLPSPASPRVVWPSTSVSVVGYVRGCEWMTL